MTYPEAIEVLKQEQEFLATCEETAQEPENGLNHMMLAALDLAIPAVEKCIAKRSVKVKPVQQNWGALDSCPSCHGGPVYNDEDFCRFCGQKFDWRKEG